MRPRWRLCQRRRGNAHAASDARAPARSLSLGTAAPLRRHPPTCPKRRLQWRQRSLVPGGLTLMPANQARSWRGQWRAMVRCPPAWDRFLRPAEIATATSRSETGRPPGATAQSGEPVAALPAGQRAQRGQARSRSRRRVVWGETRGLESSEGRRQVRSAGLPFLPPVTSRRRRRLPGAVPQRRPPPRRPEPAGWADSGSRFAIAASCWRPLPARAPAGEPPRRGAQTLRCRRPVAARCGGRRVGLSKRLSVRGGVAGFRTPLAARSDLCRSQP